MILDDPKAIKKLDKTGMLESASLLPDQIKQTWEEVFKVRIDVSKFRQAENIIAAGVGGSSLGAKIIDSLNFEVLKVPLEVVTSYHLPAYANRKSLVIVSSYSGNTEETLSCYREAVRRGCQVFTITNNGQLAELATKNRTPLYLLLPRYNPSHQPRMGLGYSITAQLALMARVDLIHFDEAQVTRIIRHLESLRGDFIAGGDSDTNQIKKLAPAFKDKAVAICSAEHLIGAAHAFKNMVNENSKTFAVRFSLPEMNHHLLEGLGFPQSAKKTLKFLFLESDIYDQKIKKRLKITQQVIDKNGYDWVSLKLNGHTRVEQAFEVVYLGGFFSVYLGLLNNVDPAPIPWVDFFKEQLNSA
jgi:glucose/mannose-6-phosphate isomerase